LFCMERDESKKNLKSLHTEVPVEFHRRIKMLCVMQDINMKDYTLAALKEKVARDEAQMKAGQES